MSGVGVTPIEADKENGQPNPPPPREWSAREWNAMTEQLQSLAARLAAVSLPVEEQQP